MWPEAGLVGKKSLPPKNWLFKAKVRPIWSEIRPSAAAAARMQGGSRSQHSLISVSRRRAVICRVSCERFSFFEKKVHSSSLATAPAPIASSTGQQKRSAAEQTIPSWENQKGPFREQPGQEEQGQTNPLRRAGALRLWLICDCCLNCFGYPR